MQIPAAILTAGARRLYAQKRPCVRIPKDISVNLWFPGKSVGAGSRSPPAPIVRLAPLSGMTSREHEQPTCSPKDRPNDAFATPLYYVCPLANAAAGGFTGPPGKSDSQHMNRKPPGLRPRDTAGIPEAPGFPPQAGYKAAGRSATTPPSPTLTHRRESSTHSWLYRPIEADQWRKASQASALSWQ